LWVLAEEKGVAMATDVRVTNVETVVPDGVFIYSQTDLRGIITEANEAFAHLSGYRVEEMVGKPHNLIRHPDMPKEAFADLWKSLKAGRPWQGVVKNRRKDGGYYWVLANASPVREEGRVVGYQSLRQRPSREQIRAANDAYEKIRNGNKQLLVVEGRVVHARSVLSERMASVDFQLSLVLLVALMASLAGIGGAAWGAQSAFWRLGAESLGTLSGILILFAMVRALPKLGRDLCDLEDYLDAILSSGDLTLRFNLDHEDRFGGIAKKMVLLITWMQSTVLCIQDAVLPVQEGTQKIQIAITEIDQAAKSQNMATASVAAASTELDLTIREVAEHLQVTETAVSETGRRAVSGAEVSQRATDKIQSLAATINKASVEVEALGTSSAEVGVIAAVIREIADQTNLLALNASIEAARAGEAGRGFAVVANEVRSLADRTMKATAKIDALIGTIKGDSDRAITGMRSGSTQVAEGVSLVQQAQDSLNEINHLMSDAVQKVSEIATASSQQTEAMNEISNSITHVAAMTEENVSVVQSTTEQIVMLTPLVDRVRKAVTQYQV
jgi:aerotaxis receptor